MSEPTIGIIGGGQLGSMLCIAARNLNIKSIIISDDNDAPAQFFADEFIFCKYDDILKVEEFSRKIDFVTFEFENIPYATLTKIDDMDDDEFGEPRSFATNVAVSKIAEDILNDIMTTW